MYLRWFPGCVNFRGQFDSQVQSVSRRTFTVQSQCLQSYKCVLWKNNILHETANIQDLMCPYARTLKLTLYVLDDYKSVRPQFETICMVSKKNCFPYELKVYGSLSLACKLKSYSIFQCTVSCDRVVTQ